MTQSIPEPTIARGAPLGPPPGHIAYSGAAESPVNLVTRTPPPNATPAIQDGRKRRVVGLVPAAPGSMHAIIVKSAPAAKVSREDISRTRNELRRAQRTKAAKESALIATTGPHNGGAPSDEYKTALTEARDANDLVAALTRKLGELEASAVQRPDRVALVRAREPHEVSDEIANGDAVYVCMHEDCRREGHEWPDEASMRRAREHAPDKMTRKQECHVFALRCDAPLDPLDPDGERVGYVAPVGSDGTTVERAGVAPEDAASAEEVSELRATVKRLEAMLEALASGKGPGPKKSA